MARNNLFIVVARTTNYETIVDSVWDNNRSATKRANHIWEYPDVFSADVQTCTVNDVDYNTLYYELTKDDYEYEVDEW